MEKKPSNLKTWRMVILGMCLTVTLMIITIVIMSSADDGR